LFFVFLFFTTLFAEDIKKLEKVSVQFKWKHQFQFAGFYIAKEKGFYKDIGLDVELFEYEHGQDIVENVLSGKNEYGVGYSSLILDKTQDKEIVLLSALLQSSPHVLVTLKSSGIRSIKDFKNKKIMIANEATYTTSFLSMLRSHGVSFSDMQRLDPNLDVQKLIDKEVDIIAAYRTNQVYALQEKGINYNIWDPKEYGFDFYDDILFTSKKELQNHPHRVESFKYATLKGYEYAYAHPYETIKLIKKKYDTQKKKEEALIYEGNSLKALAYAGGNAFGNIDPIKIQRILDIYNLFGHIKERVNLEEFIYKSKHDFYLTDEERNYLSKKKVVKMCVDPNWMPFEEIRAKQHVGMSADYFEIIKKKLPVEFQLVQVKTWTESIALAKQRKCDIMSLVMSTPERKKYLNFTDAYLNIPLVVATKIHAPFVADFSSLKNKRVGITKDYAFLELLRVKYPNLDIVEVENLEDGLQQVVNGSIYGYIGTLATIGYSLQKNFTGELKIAGKFDGSWDLGIGVRNDDALLYQILQKTVQSVDHKEKQKIINDWLAIKYEKSIDYRLLLQIIIGFIFMLILVMFFYLRERKLKKDVQINQTLLEAIINNIPNPMFYKDKSGVFKNINNAFAENILGLKKSQVIGKTLQDLESVIPFNLIKLHGDQDKLLYESQLSQEYELIIKISDGSIRDFKITKTVFKSENGECMGYIAIMSDITELKNKEKSLKMLASIDPLTKLYNRRSFSEMASHLFNLAKRDKESISLVMVDIDNFKNINDTYGHKIGDDVIILVSSILLTMSRESDIVARFGGEEFLMLLPKTDIQGAVTIAEKIRAKIEESSLSIDKDKEIKFTISLGVSEVFIKNETDIEAGIKRADDALYKAKRNGKNKVCSS
jgi:diguanylate cyclase (GGDEF)-like protein/PAS domain S-box-containing protein